MSRIPWNKGLTKETDGRVARFAVKIGRYISISRGGTGIRQTQIERACYKHGISAEQYIKMRAAQGGVCAICLKPESVRYKGTLANLCVDHHHGTGTIRGLLCNKCNRAIGLINDDVQVAKRMLSYMMEESKWVNVI